jgi:hypothetical protein
VNQGFGAAVFSGYTSASKDWILYTDADRQFVLSEIASFVPAMEHVVHHAVWVHGARCGLRL